MNKANMSLLVFKKKWKSFFKHFRKSWQLYLLILLPFIYILIFYYYPMYGVQIAFRDFSFRKGILGSEWVGLKWFQKILNNYQFKEVFSNTVSLSLYSIVVGFPLPIIFALCLNALQNKKIKKFVQTVSYIPHFISVTVLVSMINMIFSPVSGLYGTIYRMLGGAGYPSDFRSVANSFRHLYVWSGIWQELGWDAIIYMSALAGVSQEHHEAAMIDGASRLQRIIHVDFPAILPTCCVMLILRCGSVMMIGFEKVYLMQTSLNLKASEVISTYVYKVSMGSASDFSYGTAVGLFNSLINCAILIVVNYICKKSTADEISLF